MKHKDNRELVIMGAMHDVRGSDEYTSGRWIQKADPELDGYDDDLDGLYWETLEALHRTLGWGPAFVAPPMEHPFEDLP